MSNPQLQKIAEIEILGEKYTLAANGEGCLVRLDSQDKDAFGNPVARVVPIEGWLLEGGGTAKFQALLDELVKAHRSTQSHRDARLGGRE